MSTKVEALVEYLAGGEGPDSERVRAEVGDPSGEYGLFLAGARQLSRAALGEEVLRRVSLFAGSALGASAAGQDLPDVPPEAPDAIPAPGSPFSRLWSAGRAVPWVVSAVSCVFVVLLWYENREQRHRVDVTLTIIERHLVEMGKAPPAGPVVRVSGPAPALPPGKPGAGGLVPDVPPRPEDPPRPGRPSGDPATPPSTPPPPGAALPPALPPASPAPPRGGKVPPPGVKPPPPVRPRPGGRPSVPDPDKPVAPPGTGAVPPRISPADLARLADLLVPRLLAGLKPQTENPRKDPDATPAPPKGLTPAEVQKVIEAGIEQALRKARAEDRQGLAEEVRKAVDEALKGRPSREDLTGLEQRLGKRLARVEALLTVLVRRPAGALPKDLDKLVRGIVAEELALLRKQLRADVYSILRSWRGPGDRPAAGPPGAGGPPARYHPAPGSPGKVTPAPLPSARASRPQVR